jgi:hypothetical protein
MSLPVGSVPARMTITINSLANFPDLEGHYRWLGTEAAPRLSGDFLAPHHPFPGRSLFRHFGSREFRGRIVNIQIPAVGIFPARLYGRAYDNQRSVRVEFHSWCPPVPTVRPRELASALRTPIYDALAHAGHDDLAQLALAAAVALAGWPAEGPLSGGRRT